MDGLERFAALMKTLGGPTSFCISLASACFLLFLWFGPTVNQGFERIGLGMGFGVFGMVWVLSTGLAFGAAIEAIGKMTRKLVMWGSRCCRIRNQSKEAKDVLCSNLVILRNSWSVNRKGSSYFERELIAEGIVEDYNAYANVIDHEYWGILTGKLGWWLLYSGKYKPTNPRRNYDRKMTAHKG